MFKQIIVLCAVALSLLSVAFGESTVTVDFYAPNSNCKKPATPPQASVTYVVNKCYNGKMYACDWPYESITYMIYPDLACGSMYPKTYGLPADMCLSPVYAYSAYDSFFTCSDASKSKAE